MSPRASHSLRLLVAGPLIVLLLSACADGTVVGTSPAATLAGTNVTDEQVSARADLFRFLSSVQQQPCGTTIDARDTQEAACNRLALSNLIQQRVADDYAAQHDVTISAKEIDDTIGVLDSQLGADQVDQALKAASITREDLEPFVRSLLTLQRVQEEVSAAELDDDALRDLYQEQLASFTTVTAHHILVESEDEARQVYEQATAAGFTLQDFERLAKQVSTDPSAQQNGGDLGTAPASNYVPEFADAVSALEPGEVSEPVQTDFGWHVIWLEDKQVQPFDEVKDQLAGQGGGTAFHDWLLEQYEKGDLEVNPKYGRLDRESLLIVPIRSTDPSATPSGAGASPTGP